jgi:hypothetical protein
MKINYLLTVHNKEKSPTLFIKKDEIGFVPSVRMQITIDKLSADVTLISYDVNSKIINCYLSMESYSYNGVGTVDNSDEIHKVLKKNGWIKYQEERK